MFKRLIFEDAAAVFTIVAFFTALSIFVTITWRALRMKRTQLQHFENLSFATATPSSRHEADCSPSA